MTRLKEVKTKMAAKKKKAAKKKRR